MEQRIPEADSITMAQITIGEPLGQGTGHISAEGFELDEAQELLDTITAKYLVKVSPDAAGCCIDGRCGTHTMSGEPTQPGPSVAGGPELTAYGAAELVPGYFGDTSAQDTYGRLLEVRSTLLAKGIRLGGHITDTAHANNFINPKTGAEQTGCGLNDQFKEVMTKPADSRVFVEAATSLLLGDTYDETAMQFSDGATVSRNVKDHSPRQALESLAGEDQTFSTVEVLLGDHAEVLVVFNYVEGTTVDRDALVSDTGKQVFVIDMWYIDKLANALAEGRPDAVSMEQQLQHAMVAFQVATYLTLCDGSHRPALLKPEPAYATVA